MNRSAKIFHTKNSSIDVGNILNVRGFDLNRILELECAYHEHD